MWLCDLQRAGCMYRILGVESSSACQRYPSSLCIFHYNRAYYRGIRPRQLSSTDNHRQMFFPKMVRKRQVRHKEEKKKIIKARIGAGQAHNRRTAWASATGLGKVSTTTPPEGRLQGTTNSEGGCSNDIVEGNCSRGRCSSTYVLKTREVLI